MLKLNKKIIIDPKKYEEISDNISRIVANLNIYGLNGKVVIDTTGNVPTACWLFNPRTNEYIIKLGYELFSLFNEDEMRGVIEHELLHHVQYRECDIRDHDMSNLILDIAINKTLYLCDAATTESWAKKTYTNLDKKLNNPIIWAVPFLDASQIEQISDPKIKNIYIEIWGNRKTINDFNYDVPIPLSLYYKIKNIIPQELLDKLISPFGEDIEIEIEDFSEGQGETGQEKKEKDGKGQKNKVDADKTLKETNKKKKKVRIRCQEVKDEEKDKDNDSSKDNDKDNDSSGDDDKNKDNDSKDNDSKDKNNDGNEDDKKDIEQKNKYSSFDKAIEEFYKEKTKKAEKAGKGASTISFVAAPEPDFECNEIDKVLKKRAFRETIEELNEAIVGSFSSDIVRLPYIQRPTKTTITHIACGVTDYLPFYYNHRAGNAKPKIACYVDVSGSMRCHMSLVHSLMVKLGEFLPSVSFIFHDYVMPLPTLAWNDTIPLGGNTEFDSIIQHACISPDKKKEWFEKWVDNHEDLIKTRFHYYSNSQLVNGVVEYLHKYGVQADFISEDFSEILIITDGQDKLSRNSIELFKKNEKKLTILLLANKVQEKHAFVEIANQVIQINKKAEIIDKKTF